MVGWSGQLDGPWEYILSLMMTSSTPRQPTLSLSPFCTPTQSPKFGSCSGHLPGHPRMLLTLDCISLASLLPDLPPPPPGICSSWGLSSFHLDHCRNLLLGPLSRHSCQNHPPKTRFRIYIPLFTPLVALQCPWAKASFAWHRAHPDLLLHLGLPYSPLYPAPITGNCCRSLDPAALSWSSVCTQAALC